jgi:microsomal dipeptidase-like Zn-dependent dipeptidase
MAAPIPFIVDLHCHPSTKPFGKSFKLNTIGINSRHHGEEHSIWYNDSPNAVERLIQTWAQIVKFRQADLSSLAWGNCRVVVASLYPIERGFFKNKFGVGVISDLVGSFVSGVSKRRVNHIQNLTAYFDDLTLEYNYYAQLHDTYVNINNTLYRYKLVHAFQEVIDHQKQHPDDAQTIFIIISIEGLHVLMGDIDQAPEEQIILSNLMKIKNWEYAPFFITVAHHFDNKICGHAKSLYGQVAKHTDQREGQNKNINPIGLKVIEQLLDPTIGRRIYVDVKHMSIKSRLQYYDLLETKYKSETIPIIVSHGALMGRTRNGKLNTISPDLGKTFFARDINFYDEEILAIARSGGVFGLQLDERRLASPEKMKSLKNPIFLHKIRHVRAELLWNQIQYIAELLNKNRLPAWDIMAIGSDFDGIINPINGFLTAEELNTLMEFIERYAYNYMNDRGKKELSRRNQIKAAEIVQRIFSTNATHFLTRWFI